MDRSTASQGEVKALISLNGTPAVIDPSILVVDEGYTASELGLTASNLRSPPIVPTFEPPLTGVHVVQRGAVLPEDASVTQRFTFAFAMHFDDDSTSNFASPFQDITVTAVLSAAGQTVANTGLLRLLKSPDPYILDGDPNRGLIVEIDLDGQTIPSWADTDIADPAHPAVPLDDMPDELMIAWGNVPTGTHASIYLPTVAAAAALDWAHRMYVSNRLWLVDTHTLACEAGGVTLVPIPGAAEVDHVGLMAVELPPTVNRGERDSVRVRQRTGARFGAGRQVEVAKNGGRRGRAELREALGGLSPEFALSSFESAARMGSCTGGRSVRSVSRSR